MIETTLIPNSYILPNPWQPRESEDEEHIRNLAISIGTEGLMQFAVGRWVDPQGQLAVGLEFGEPEDVLNAGFRVQLAFGHSRLAAFKFLDETGNEGFDSFPVAIRDLEDEEMFRLAISENVQRRDLNPMEEARAMLRFRDEFGKTSGEIGKLFGLAESSVRNKMRLLGLPREIQEAAGKGQISEGAARELLRIYDMPAEMQEKAKNYRHTDEWNSKSIVTRALEGLPADQVRVMITRVVQQSGKNLHEAQWKWDEAFDKALHVDIRSETCKGCEFKTAIDERVYCTAFNCFYAKRDLWIKRRLAAASEACGIRVPENIHDCGTIRIPAEVRESGCANLRVVYDEYMSRPDDKDSLVPGFKDVKIVCGNRNSICSCQNGLIARRVAEEKQRQLEDRLKKTGEFIEGLKEEPAGQVQEEEPRRGPSADELRQAAQDDRQAQKQAMEEVIALREDFARRVRDAMLGHNRFAWYFLLKRERFALEYKRERVGQVEESAYEAAMELSNENYYQSRIDPEAARRDLNKLLVAMELRPMEAIEDVKEPVYEPIEEEHYPQQLPGETLAEYFERTEK